MKFLARGPAEPRPGRGAGRMLLDGGERGTIEVTRAALQQAIHDDLVRVSGKRIRLSQAGVARLRRGDGRPDAFQRQHRETATARLDAGAGPEQVVVNEAESPLRSIARRKDRHGRPFLAAEEVRAGERLRSDFTRGRLMPRLGANWQATVSSGRRDGGRGVAELTEAALAARLRVEKAVQAVGPELSGVLIDICCFLKGLETVEAERGWPVRSAKVVLKTALGALARHYWPTNASENRSAREILHWGTENYLPRLNGGDG